MDHIDMLVEAAPPAQEDSRNGRVVAEDPPSGTGHGSPSHLHLEVNGQPHNHTGNGSASPPVRQNTISSVSTMATLASNATSLHTVASPSTPTNENVQPHLNGQLSFSANDTDGTSKKKGGARRRTGPLTEEQRQRAALMRRLGACDTCRAKRVGCNPGHRGKTWDEAAKEYRDRDDTRRNRSISPLRDYRPSYRERDRGSMDQRPSASPVTSNLDSEDVQMDQAMYQPDGRHRLPGGTGLGGGGGGGGSELRFSRTPLPSAPGRSDTKGTFSPYGGAPVQDSPLQRIASRILADPNRCRYRDVHVLMLYWEHDDDTNTRTAVETLGNTFTNSYHYAVQTRPIPPDSLTQTSWTWLNNTLTEFMQQQNDQPDVLKILYYNGYSHLRDGQIVLASSSIPDAEPSARWTGLQQILEEACQDTLLLMDTAYYPISPISRKQGVFELLAATHGADHANQLGRHTFTQALTDLLSRRATQKPSGDLTVSDIHAQLLYTLYPQAAQAQTKEQQPPTTGLTTPTPLHLRLSGPSRQPSILLESIDTQGDVQNGTAAQSGFLNGQTKMLFNIEVPPVAVNNDSWAEWLRLAPPGVRCIEVEGSPRA